MPGYRIDFSRIQQLNANSEVLAGAKLYAYQNRTTTPVAVYSDRDIANTATNPIVADSAGRFAVRYVASGDMLTLALYDANDVAIWSDHDIEPVPNQDNAALADYLALAGGELSGAVDFAEGDSVASAASINLDRANVGGNFLHITGTTTISAITLRQGGARLVVFDGALTLVHSSNLLLPGAANITTEAGDRALLFGEGSGVTRMIWFALHDGRPLVERADIIVGVGNETSALSTGTAKRTFRMPFTLYLDPIPFASLTTAQSSGNIVTIDVNDGGASIFSTPITINNNTTTSVGATTPAALSDTVLAEGAQITIDIDQCDGSTAAAGLKVYLRGYRRNRT